MEAMEHGIFFSQPKNQFSSLLPLLRIHQLDYPAVAIIPKHQGPKATKSSHMTIVGQAVDSGTQADSHYGNIAGL